MEAVIAFSGAAFVFFAFLTVPGFMGKNKAKERLLKLFTTDTIENVHNDVIKEQQKKLVAKKNSKWLSIGKGFADFIALSGIKLSAGEFLCIWAGAVFVPVILLLALGCHVVTVAGIGLTGLIIPPLLVRRAKGKRQQLFNRQLGEALVIMGNCIKSGYSFQQAMESIASDMQPPISAEFAKTIREIRYGVRTEDALNHMVERVKDKDLDLLVSAIVTSTQVGGNLSDILDTISSTIKDRIKIRDEVRILTSSGRISGIIIGLLPVIITLFLMLINPTYIQSFFGTLLGKIMIAAAVILEATGFTIVNKIVDIKY